MFSDIVCNIAAAILDTTCENLLAMNVAIVGITGF
jgi:hypothetical protein